MGQKKTAVPKAERRVNQQGGSSHPGKGVQPLLAVVFAKTAYGPSAIVPSESLS